MSFKDKVAIITGAGNGIGKVTAQKYAEAGAKLTLVDIDEAGLKSVAEELPVSEDDYLIVTADVSDEAEVKKYVDKTVEKFGQIDIFFNNAGIEGKMAPITQSPGDNLDAVLDVNVKGVFYGLKHVMPVMMEEGSGSIVNTASVAGLVGFPGLSPYVASKHAVIGLTKTAALEAGDDGVRINAVCPAPVETRMMRSIESQGGNDPDAVKESFAESIPLKRYGEPEEIADLVLFLTSEEASYINGSYYRVDGGMGAS